MKNRTRTLIFTCIVILFPKLLFGNAIDSTRAKTIAANFINSKIAQNGQSRLKSGRLQNSELRLAHQEVESTSLNGNRSDSPYYYIYNLNGGNGFIIVSGEDSSLPILGYTFEGKYDSINQPPAFKEWMNGYKRQIKHLRSIKTETLQSNSAKIISDASLKSTNSNAATEVLPMITAKWNQGCYYNNFCPTSSLGSCGKTYVGCVAVAMALVMNYWKAPYSCTVIPGYTSYTLKYNLPYIYSTIYDWDNMSDSLVNTSSAKAINAVSELLYHCGVSVQMNYTYYGSGATMVNAREAICNIFKYPNSVQYVERVFYPTAKWIDLIKNELNNGRPVIYSGYDKTSESGHAFVCDGYNKSDFFHINWGWGGYYNGYFSLNILSPDNTSGFDINQGAIIGIMPSISLTKQTVTDLTSDISNPNNTGSITITTNTAWTASSDQSWLKPINTTGVEGNLLRFSAVEKNTTNVIREATITVKSKSNVTKSFKISQLPDKSIGSLLLYPNPCFKNQNFTFEINDFTTNLNNYKLTIYSDKGEIINEIMTIRQKSTLQISRPGIYIVRLMSKSGTVKDIKRLIIL